MVLWVQFIGAIMTWTLYELAPCADFELGENPLAFSLMQILLEERR